MRTSDYNKNGSTVSEVYNLLEDQTDTSNVRRQGNNFILNKPAQNSELKEIKFRKFTPIMKKSLSTLSSQNAEISVRPRFLKSTKVPGTHTYITNFTRDTSGGSDLNIHYGTVTIGNNPSQLAVRITNTKQSAELPLNKGGFDDYIYDLTFTLPTSDVIRRRVGFLSESISLFNQNDHKFEGTSYTVSNTTATRWVSNAYQVLETQSYGTYMILFTWKYYDENRRSNELEGFAQVDIAVYYWQSYEEYMNAYERNNAWQNFERDHPANEGLISIERLDVWGRDQCDNYMRTNTLWATKAYTYKSQMLATDESRCAAFTYANGTKLDIKPSTLKTKLIGSAEEICANINEKLAGYFSNFKPSSTIHIVDPDYQTWTLAQYVDDPLDYGPKSGYTYDASGMKLADYYRWANMILTAREHAELFNPDLVGQFAQVVPQCYFTRLYSKVEKAKTASDTYEHTLANTVFGVHNMVFSCRQFKQEVDPLTNSHCSSECMWLYFEVEVHCDTDIFNISTDRMWHNTYERIRDKQWSDKMACFFDYNQCISTNEDTVRNLIYANYLAHGLDLILRSPIMNNVTNIIFVNETESQVIMKHTQQHSTANCVIVNLSDIEGNTIELNYLKQIYRAILLEIDFIFG